MTNTAVYPVLQRVNELRAKCVKLRTEAWHVTGDKYLDDRLEEACLAFLRIEDHYRERVTAARKEGRHG